MALAQFSAGNPGYGGPPQFSEAEIAKIKAFCAKQDEELAEIGARWKAERELRAKRHEAYMAHLRRKVFRAGGSHDIHKAFAPGATQADLESILKGLKNQ